MPKKESILKWSDKDKKDLEKAINQFNRKIKKLKQTRKDKSYLPEELDYERTIKENMITTRSELNRVLESLGRFKGKEAFKKVTLPSGQTLTKWEHDELKKEQRIATLRIRKRMNEIKKQRPEYFTGISEGNEEYQRLKSTLEAIQNFGLKKPSKVSERRSKEIFEEAKVRIENWASADFEMRRAIIYRENYFKMLKERYEGLDNYDKVVEALKKIQNPITFYEKLKNFESGEQLKDITFMYENTPYQENLNKLAISLGIEIEDEDVVTKEGE